MTPFYLPAASGQRFCLFHQPEVKVVRRGAVVYVHPFAEEMNKSRRMASMQARMLAAAGYAVLQIDLLGCGDSSGDFGDAAWASWVDDVELACDWLLRRSEGEFWLWGLRSGCLLACEAAGRLSDKTNFLLWQPVISGKQFLQQFMRLKLAGEILGGEGKGLMDRLREQLAHGGSVEIAGYELSSELAGGLEQAELSPPAQSGRIEWIELTARPDGGLSPLAGARIEKWQAAGHQARGIQVHGSAFWQTTEIVECPALLDASLRAVKVAAPG
jgi:exosortase A-associated hydrolase 2